MCADPLMLKLTPAHPLINLVVMGEGGKGVEGKVYIADFFQNLIIEG